MDGLSESHLCHMDHVPFEQLLTQRLYLFCILLSDSFTVQLAPQFAMV